MLRKNVSGQFVHIAGVNATTGAIVTGATWTMRRCLDGTFAAGGATLTEDGTTGFYKVALTQADTNGNDIGYFFTATSCVPVTLNVITTAADPTDGVRFGLTALPNAAAAGSGGLPVIGTSTNNFKSDSSANVTYANAAPPTAAAIATGVWQDTTAGDFTVALSVGKSLMNGVTLGTGLTVNDITTKTGFSLSGTQTFNVTGNITGNLSGSVGSVTGLTASNLDAAVSSRMATYSQPTGFLAATFPTTVASTTNITAGTITTVTNLTNAPTSGDFTATMKTSIGTAVAASAVASVTGNVGGNVTGSVGSVVGAVGSVTGNVGGNVTGSVGSVAAVVSANITKVNGTTVTGDGSPGTEWGP